MRSLPHNFKRIVIEMPDFLITIDVEDWFQVENFKECIPFSSWNKCEFRLKRNTDQLLDLFDSVNLDNSRSGQNKVRATFFILGWVAERYPEIVREIQGRGHEIASHGYNHSLCIGQDKKDLNNDLVKSKKLLEDITGTEIYGYRAPSFSADMDVLRRIRDSGYVYDSSYNSFSLHGRYGKIFCGVKSGDGKGGLLREPLKGLYELPISNIRLGNHVIPWGGGAYFRIIPEGLFRLGIRYIIRKERAYLLYLHPWEVDPRQPKVGSVSRFCRFRHYTNLNKTYKRLEKIIEYFANCEFISCINYIGSQ